MEIGGYEIILLCRPVISAYSSIQPPPSPSHQPLSNSSNEIPSINDLEANYQINYVLKHNSNTLYPKNEKNIYFLPSFTKNFSKEIINLQISYTSSNSKIIEFNEIITLEKSIKSSTAMKQIVELKKNEILLKLEIQSTWIPLEFLEITENMKLCQVNTSLLHIIVIYS